MAAHAVSTKRLRSTNWLEAEVQCLLSHVKQHSQELFSRQNTSATIKRKQEIWNAITERVNAVDDAIGVRSFKQIRKKWADIRQYALRQENARKNTPAGTRPPQVQWWQNFVMDMLTDKDLLEVVSFSEGKDCEEAHGQIDLEETGDEELDTDLKLNYVETIQFIKLFCKHKALWDRADSDYLNTTERERQREEIGNAIGITEAEVKMKISKLCSRYQHELRKKERLVKNGLTTVESYMPRWPYFYALNSFLAEVYKNREDSTDVNELHENDSFIDEDFTIVNNELSDHDDDDDNTNSSFNARVSDNNHEESLDKTDNNTDDKTDDNISDSPAAKRVKMEPEDPHNSPLMDSSGQDSNQEGVEVCKTEVSFDSGNRSQPSSEPATPVSLFLAVPPSKASVPTSTAFTLQDPSQTTVKLTSQGIAPVGQTSTRPVFVIASQKVGSTSGAGVSGDYASVSTGRGVGESISRAGVSRSRASGRAGSSGNCAGGAIRTYLSNPLPTLVDGGSMSWAAVGGTSNTGEGGSVEHQKEGRRPGLSSSSTSVRGGSSSGSVKVIGGISAGISGNKGPVSALGHPSGVLTTQLSNPLSSQVSGGLVSSTKTGVSVSRTTSVAVKGSVSGSSSSSLPPGMMLVEEDDDWLFCRYIVSELKKVENFKDKQLAKMKIQQIITYAQLGMSQ